MPVGTVPIYEALERANGDVSGITWDLFKQVQRGIRGATWAFAGQPGLDTDRINHAWYRSIRPSCRLTWMFP